MKLKIALAQIPVSKSISKNTKTILCAIDEAAEKAADILLTPEGALSGYTHKFCRNNLKRALSEVEAHAKEKHIGLALGTCKDEENGCYNELRFYSKDGEFLGFHAKILLCGKARSGLGEKLTGKENKGEIIHFKTKPLEVFDFCGIKIGGLICNDLWANPNSTVTDDPHLANKLADMGAKIIFHAANGWRNKSYFSQHTIKQYHESNVLMRANAAGIPIATVDNASPLDTPVASIGGVASKHGKWIYRISEVGEHIDVFEVNVRK